ncbi:ATP-binding cassette domain-containing protein [Streptomyces sp. CA-111067]|uniref:ATP-binding cassette domain-containing protein n=1 Tax=Streptomyces sp. CA-111067 TaxID=3240046 RepID=UPI003D9875E7
MQRTLAGPDASIQVRDVHKRFGSTRALAGMTFDVRPGQVTGFVGPNGAGKSTTMRVILGLDRPDEGTALVGGRPYRDLPEPLTHLGALLDSAAVLPSRTARHHLLWLAHSQGLGARRVDEVIGQVGLQDAARRKAGGFSLGMRQRLGIAAALLGDPPAVMLDEPFNGLDPEGFQWMRGFLATLAEQGRAVLISSHLMSELQGSADHVVVVGRGKVLADVGVRELLASMSQGRLSLRTSARTEAMAVLARAGATVSSTGEDEITVTGLPAEGVVSVLSANGLPVTGISEHQATLEEAYMELTRDAVQFRGTAASAAAEEAGR